MVNFGGNKGKPLGWLVARELQGVPRDWETVNIWLNGLAVANPPPSKDKPAGLNWPLIPPLENYNAAPGADFWANFPYRGLPTHVTTSVNKSALRSLLHQRKNNLTRHQVQEGR
jgi:hypothetical protein